MPSFNLNELFVKQDKVASLFVLTNLALFYRKFFFFYFFFYIRGAATKMGVVKVLDAK